VAALAIDEVGPAKTHPRASPRTGINRLRMVYSCSWTSQE